MKTCKIIFIVLFIGILSGGHINYSLAQETHPITLRLPDVVTVQDPVLTISMDEVDAVTNLFATLFYTRPDNVGVIEPYLVKSWQVSDDGRTYTFTLRDDISWVKYDPDTNSVIQLRIVNAYDVVYSVQRMCSSLANGYYATDVLGPVIEGCQDALNGQDVEVVAVEALGADTVQFRLTIPGDYFLSMLTLWTLSPVPGEVVKAHGEDWIQPEYILTSGPFTLATSDSEGLFYIRNPHLPEDLRGPGNIEKVIVNLEDSVEAFNNGEIERSYLSAVSVQQSNPELIINFSESSVFYIGISNDKPPMDNVHVRRALAAALPHDEFITEIGATATPIYHFAPEVLFGGLPGTAVGMGYDPEYARQELIEAGYPECQGMPALIVDSQISAFIREQLEAIGCTDVQVEFGGDSIDPVDGVSAEDRPHLWLGGWGPDYADADNFMALLECGVNNYFRKDCTKVDDKIRKARQSNNPEERLNLYHGLQKDLFGRNGEFPIIPLYITYEIRTVQPWFLGPHETNGIVGGERYDYYTISASAGN